MRAQKVLPPNEPFLEQGTVPVRSTWWRFFHNLFGDVQDNQGMSIAALLPSGPDRGRQIGDVQTLTLQRGITQIGEMERKLSDLQSMINLQAASRAAEVERKLSDLQAFIFAAMRPPAQDIDSPTQTIGTWTPADNSGASLSFSAVSAGYTQIGNIVHAYFTLTYPVTASGSSASISGLPITVANVNYAQVPAIVDTSASITGGLVLSPVKNTLTATFDVGTPFGPATNLQLSTASVSAMLIYPAS